MPLGIVRFANSENGTATVEAVFWFAIMTALIILITWASIAFQGYTPIARSIQDGNRQLSIGRYKTVAEAEAYIERQLALRDVSADATVTLNGNMIDTTVVVPWSAIDRSGFLEATGMQPVTFTARHRVEWLP
ncbi:hypothetical protein [Jannaschia formosa]|uniref:hypothetical protein n=1 Tax=Jannaschia formosa TaxID=2259592 RepID=UPI000E1B5C6E|nr:hypothetical protein [Jannaschia formosa]TFL15989.1 hypothetical protein DR046_22440 [Jannaschia formosa]